MRGTLPGPAASVMILLLAGCRTPELIRDYDGVDEETVRQLVRAEKDG